MKKLLPALSLLALSACALPASAQTILNGSFEDNIVLDDSLSLTEPGFDNTVNHCHTIDGGFMDVISSSTYCGAAQEGSFFIQNTMTEYYGAFSMELSGPLVVGQDYELSFWSRNCAGTSGLIVLGYTQYDSTLGATIATVNPATHTAWTLNTLTFTAMQPYGHIYADMQNFSLSNRMQVDNFSLTPITSAAAQMDALAIQAGPNPVTDAWTVEMPLAGTVEWINLQGMAVKHMSLAQGTHSLSRENLPAGAYAYRITLANGQRVAGTLLMQ